MFDLRTTLLKATEALRKEQIAHALIGGFALAFHGINRATADLFGQWQVIEDLRRKS
jgi:hypothetical protein